MSVISPSLVPKIKAEYVKGEGSVREICERYNVPSKPMEIRASSEGWTKERKKYLEKVCEKGIEKGLSEVDEWLKEQKTTCRSEWNMITESIKGLNTSGQGVDADAIATYARARLSYNTMIRQGLGIADVNMDIRSDGKDIGTSIVDALAKLRANPQPYKPLSPEEMKLAIECEIVPDNEG